jgi:hypothetical protein
MGLLAVLLTVLFVGLKLTGVVAWSWFWVVSPVPIYVVLDVTVWVFMCFVIAWGDFF